MGAAMAFTETYNFDGPVTFKVGIVALRAYQVQIAGEDNNPGSLVGLSAVQPEKFQQVVAKLAQKFTYGGCELKRDEKLSVDHVGGHGMQLHRHGNLKSPW